MNPFSITNQEGLFQLLTDLAMDLHWSWNHATDEIWRQLDPTLWELTHNPLVVLQTVSHEKVMGVLADPIVRDIIKELSEDKKQHLISPAWFQRAFPDLPFSAVAYFSMEFMLSEALPIYSGGLGNVAGDHLKTASDLGVPVIGLGLLYQQGYSRQVVYKEGSQQYVAPFNDPGQLPVSPLRKPNGEWLRIEVKLPGYSVWLRTWKVVVGRTMLLLLDSNDAANFPIHRGITNELYGSGAELRFLQELILGMGGWRLLEALDIKPEVCHLNEGHTAFLVIERAVRFMEENNLPFHEAFSITRSGNVFTTHTAVGASFDQFSPALIEQYLGNFIKERLKIPLEEFLALGRQNPHDETELFNTGYLAVRGCSKINGVSRLHSEVSRHLFANLFPRWPIAEVPVTHVTNGVHMPTWDSPEADRLWTEACGKDRWLGSLDSLSQNMEAVSDARIWAMRSASQETFITYVRNRYSHQLATIGASLNEIDAAKKLFDPTILTLGFARRFAKYKRPNLLLQNPGRLHQILSNKERPVQLVIAGKAHAADKEGQLQIQQWLQFVSQYRLSEKVVFLSDYDMILTEHLVQGVDLWINTPRRPWEACGTSGMKVLVNGGLNLSVLDGWWDEAFNKDVGWAVNEANITGSERENDEKSAEQVYDLLEQEIIPEFYDQNEEKIPVAWVNRIRKSMALLTPRFSANRSLREYVDNYYLPAAHSYKKCAAERGKIGLEIFKWKKRIEKDWQKLQFGKLTSKTENLCHHFIVEVNLNGIEPTDITVELYADGVMGNKPESVLMKPLAESAHSQIGWLYTASVPGNRPAQHYTPRIMPFHPLVSVPLEMNQILWYK